jgi:hypothetical protein
MDRATLKDYLFALSHLAIIALLIACVSTLLYVDYRNQTDTRPLCAPDATAPLKVKATP